MAAGRTPAGKTSPSQSTAFACRCAAPQQDPAVLEYLKQEDALTYDIALEVSLQPEGSAEPTTITRTNLKHM